tara:strand:+ start:481 stop:666 length:186 start_codon:yes stop_codon:yes gene_type:complete
MGAARAGDAGKGFVVVASKVKNLAGKAAKATEKTSPQITEIQSKKISLLVRSMELLGLSKK